MAENPYVNKVQKADGTVIMDISNDTATPSDVLNGVTFHDRSGSPQTGSVITHNVYDGLDSTNANDALSAKQGKVLYDALKKFNFVGNFAGLARNDGRINVTIPIQGNFTSVSANKLTSISGTLYGSIGAVGCTFEIENLSCSYGYIYLNLKLDVTLANYTALAKITLISISDSNGVVFTLS